MFGTDEDILRGTKDQFILYGNGGKDTLYGSAVNDIIYGGAGSDTISAAAGDDLIYGGTGNDTVNAGAGNDTIYGEFGNDTISGDAGDDIIYGAEGNDIIDGGAGNDTIDAGEGNDIIYGGEGNDALNGGEGDDTYHFNANHGNDIVNDTDGSNTLIFGDGLSADDYDLSFDISGGFVLIHKETGETISLPDFILNPQQYDFSFDGDVKVLGGGEAREVVDGTAEDDTLNAGDGFNIIYGNGGNDTINGGEDLDFIFGGEGNDTMNGGNKITTGEAGMMLTMAKATVISTVDGDDVSWRRNMSLYGEGADECTVKMVMTPVRNEGDDTPCWSRYTYADTETIRLYGGADDDFSAVMVTIILI